MIRKNIFLILFVFTFFFSFSKSAFAACIFDGYQVICDGSVVYTVYSASNCSPTYSNTCNRGTSSCGTGYCGSNDSGCCSTAEVWSKNKQYCVKKDAFSYIWLWAKYDKSCSTADKYNSADPRLLRAGDCDCNSGGIYKACCQNRVLVNAISHDDDGTPPLEADCPSSATTIWKGGDVIDLAWAQATCNPPVVCPAAGTCPTTCHTNTIYVADGSCGMTKACPPNAPAAQTCTLATCGQSLPNGSCGTTTCPVCATGQTMYYCTTSSGTNNCLSTSSTYTSVSTCNSNLDTYIPTHTGSCFTSKPSCDSSCNPPSSGGCVPTSDCSSAAAGCIGTSCWDGCNTYYGAVDCSGGGGGGTCSTPCSVTNGVCNSSGCSSGNYSSGGSTTHYDYWSCYGSSP